MSRETFRVAAIGDLHLSGGPADVPRLRTLVDRVNGNADVLVLCGDLTCHGRREELQPLLDAAGGLDVPALAVFGNHDVIDAVDASAAFHRPRLDAAL